MERATSEELDSNVFSVCRTLLDKREEQYGDHWKEEEIDWHLSNISRKYNGLFNQLKRVPLERLDPEVLPDLINYVAILERRRQIICGI